MRPVAATPVAHLIRHAHATPYRPWLFFHGERDWCWRSWGEVADQVARAMPALDRRPAGQMVAVDAALDADAVARDLAVQAAGLCAVPRVPSPESRAADGPITPEPPAMPRARGHFEQLPPPAIDPRRALSGGAAIRRGGVWRRWSPTALGETAERVGETLGEQPAMPIVLLHGTLDQLAVRLALGWSLDRGAALVLEDAPELLESAVVWCRPTLVIAPAALLSGLPERLAKQRRRRLRAVVASGAPADDPEKLVRWRALGVRWLRWPEAEIWEQGETAPSLLVE